MMLFHVTLVEFVSKTQLKLGFSKKLGGYPPVKFPSADIQTSSDRIMIVVLVVEMDVLDAVEN